MTSSNYPDGITNVLESSALGTLVFPDPTKCHTWFDDFDKFFLGGATTPAVFADWLVTTTGGTTIVTNADGGVVAFTNDATNSHGTFAQWQGGAASSTTPKTSETFTWDSARSMWFKARFKISDATNSTLIMGLAITDASPLDASDALVFQKADTSTTLTFKAIKTGAGTTTTNVATLSNDTYVELVFAYLPNGDGQGSALPALIVYLNDNKVGQITDFTNVPTRTLTVTLGAANGAAGTNVVLSTDYILCAKRRS